MPRALHLLKGEHAAEAVAVITRQLDAGDVVTVALLGGAPAPPLPAGPALHRVPEDTSYERLLELIFAADSVVAW